MSIARRLFLKGGNLRFDCWKKQQDENENRREENTKNTHNEEYET